MTVDEAIETLRYEIDEECHCEYIAVVYDRSKGGEASKILSDEEAVEYYKKTGQYLGKFDTLSEAESYAQKLHHAQDFYYSSTYQSTRKEEGPKQANWFATLLSGGAPYYSDSGFYDLKYDYINRNTEAMDVETTNAAVHGTLLAGVDKSFLQQMEDDEIKLFNYIYSTYGKDTAYQYISDITADLNLRQRKANEQYWNAFAKENPA